MDDRGRRELERRLEQSRRLGAGADILTKDRLDQLTHDLEEQLGERPQEARRAETRRRS